MTQSNFNESKNLSSLADFSFECTALPAFWIASNGDIARVNQAACNFLGYTAEQLQVMSVFEIDPSAEQETWHHHWQTLQSQKVMTFPSRHLTRKGQLKPVEVTVNFIKIGDQEYNIAFAKDLTAQREAEEALREIQERHTLVIESANDGIWDWDIQAQTICFSDRWHSMLGLPDHSCQTLDHWLSRIHPEDRLKVHSQLHDYRLGKIEQFRTEFRILHKQGHYLWVLCRGKGLYDFNAKIYRIAGSMTDITEQHHAQNQLLYDALHDSLTGLPNRNFLLAQLDELNRDSHNIQKSQFAVLFLDLDRFKLVNDSLGHHAGDQFLIEIASRLRQCLDPEHSVARLSGDEFIVLLRHVSETDAVIDIAQRILNTLTTPIALNEQIVYPSVSIGIALSETQREGPLENGETLSPEDYLQRADIAMYQAKNSGQSKYALFTQQMQAQTISRLQLEVELQSAIDREEFELAYQPIIDLHRHALLGFEALLRWNHPVKGYISPEVFIPIAEETGLILTLGTWVIKAACAQMAHWQGFEECNPHLYVTINLASHQLMQPNFVTLMDQILIETGVNPQNIKLEITESAIIESKEFARQQILALKDRQIQICMDDFGTGYSSLGYLHQLPIDCLKIDQSFVQQIQSKDDNPEIIRAIMAIAQSLNMNIIAEGIETKQQATLLHEVGCPSGQGYFFDRPLSVIDASQCVRNSRRRPALVCAVPGSRPKAAMAS